MILKEYDLECVLSAKDILCQEPPRFITIEGLAIEVGLNRTKLQYGFKKVFGLSIYDFQLQKRMEKAKHLLLRTEKSIKEIARLTGYKSTSSFSQAFKKAFGIAPLAWRNNGHGDDYVRDN
jgi:AraC-like DNA-binding protein